MLILFDAMGAQVQVQQATGNRLTTWFNSLNSLGYDYQISDYTQPIGPQLDGVNVYVSLTRQYASPSNIPAGTCFGYTQDDLKALQLFVYNGGSILMFTNHSWPIGTGPYWPINEIQLAASLGIQLVFAEFAPINADTLTMLPCSMSPAALVNGVSTVQAWDSGGIVTGNGTMIISMPSTAECQDISGLGYSPDICSFAALYTFGSGNVIVVGHSGITGNEGTADPSQGQIDAADNLTFLNNCITYLGG